MWQRNDRTGRMSSRQAHQATGKARRSLRMSVSFAVEPLERRLLLSAPVAPVVTIYPSDSTVVLAWNTVTGATKYNVYRGTQSGQETTLVKTTQGATTWTDTSLTNGVSYYYEVTAVNSSSQESVKSNEASFIPQATNTIGPSNVLVIYNEDWAGDQDGNGVQDSLQVAEYYAQVHGVPAQNILGIHGGAAALGSSWNTWSTTPYTAFYTNVVSPVVTALNTLGQNNIDVLLFCYGVDDIAPTANTSPTGVSLDDALAAPYLLTATSGIPLEVTNPYLDAAPGFDASPGQFNHNFTVRYNGVTSPLYMVSRLDGPRGLWDALEEIDQAQYAQKYLYAGAGYFNGTVYVDDEGRDGSYTDAWLQTDPNVLTGSYSDYGPADENIAQSEHYVLNSGLTLEWQNNGLLIGDTGATFTDGSSATSAPNALFFSGWYGWSTNTNAFQWLPGSVADNLISGSFENLEGNGGMEQTTVQLGRGLTAGVGSVNEPYVDGHPRPNILIYYLLQGYSFAEAAMLCTPYLGWMGLNVGDPLYTPLDPNKTAVKDTTTPAPASGFNPAAGYWDASGNYHLNLSINNSNGPEVASAVVQYGLTTAYGSTASCTAFYERPDLTLTGLTAGLTYYLKLTLTNPVGIAATYTYAFTVPPKTIYLDTFTSQGSFRYKYPTLTTLANGTAGRWDSGGGTGTATETGSGVTLTNNNYYFLPLSNINLSTTAGTYTLTAQATSTGASNQWLALGFGRGTAGASSLSTANAIATLSGPGGPASTYYGTGTAASTGHPATGTVNGNGVNTLSIILVTDGNGNATVSFSDSAGLLPPNSGGTLTPAQLANIGAIFIASNGTATGTFSNLTLTFTPADTSTTSVTSSLNPSVYSQSVTFTATVAAGHPGTGTPSGTVTFMDGTTTLGTGALNGSGIATFTTSTLSAASHSITAVYAGDANHTGSTASAVTQTVNEPPEVTGVFVENTAWSQSFLDYLAANGLGDATLGYAVPTGPSQLQSLAWSGLNQLSITFSEPVTISPSALTLTGVNVSNYSLSAPVINGNTATWTLSAAINIDTLQLSLPSASVADLAGNPLDGEWTDGSSIVSGNGVPGGDFVFHFNVLPGDADHSGTVNLSDFLILAHNFGQAGGCSVGNFLGDPTVDLSDFLVVAHNFGDSLPSSPALLAPKTALATENSTFVPASSELYSVPTHPSLGTQNSGPILPAPKLPIPITHLLIPVAHWHLYLPSTHIPLALLAATPT